MRRIASWSLIALATLASRPAPLAADELIVAGAGFAGKWDTEFELANVSPTAVDVAFWIEGLPLGVPCPPNCTSGEATIPGSGTIRVRASDFIGAVYQGPQMVHFAAQAGSPLPVVHARSVSSESSCQFAELPVFRESSIESLAVPVLVFPGVARGEGVYSNLILENLGGPPVPVEVTLLNAAGESLGTATFMVPGESTFATFTLIDVAAFFGVATLDGGQVRARALTGPGTLWGVLATVAREGSLRIAVGANP